MYLSPELDVLRGIITEKEKRYYKGFYDPTKF